jgi:hypothetical protein
MKANTVLTREHMMNMANKAANYYANPQNVSYLDKEVLFEAIALNPDIHYMALEINKKKWRKRRY